MAEGSLTFPDDLWDGFEAVFQRLTKGRHDLKAMHKFFHERAKIEDAYAKALTVTSTKAPMAVGGSLAECWKNMTSAGVNIAAQHLQFGAMCSSVAEQLEKMIGELKMNKEKAKSDHTRLCNSKSTKQRIHQKAQENYQACVTKAEKAILEVQAGKAGGALLPKQLMRLEKSSSKAVVEHERAHSDYAKSVTALASCEAEFDKSVATMLAECEAMEMKRLGILKDINTRNTQTHDFLKNSLEQIVSLCESGLSSIDPVVDVQNFIIGTKTGNTPQAHVQYVEIKSDIIAGGGASARGDAGSATASMSSMCVTTAAATPSASVSAASVSGSVSGSTAASAAVSAVQTARALYDFASDEADDLPLTVGQVVTLNPCDPEADWWSGTLNGRTGMFPRAYVQLIVSPSTMLPSPSSATNPISPAASHTQEAPATTQPQEEGPKLMNATCVALFDFAGQAVDELSFRAGEILSITGEVDGWFLGKSAAGERGIFPSNYVDLNGSS